MERLIFHLARVALNEEANRMGPGALAIVFAPCILRTSKPLPAQVSLHHITNQTTCVETILIERLRTVSSIPPLCYITVLVLNFNHLHLMFR